jgi:hypothetical protein
LHLPGHGNQAVMLDPAIALEKSGAYRCDSSEAEWIEQLLDHLRRLKGDIIV